MSSWIKSDFRFPQRAAMLVIGRRDAEDVFEIVKRHADTPDDLERCLRINVERHRPDLSGCTFWHMNFSPPKMAWEVFIEHPSLPAKAMGAIATEIPLRLDDAPYAGVDPIIADVPLVAKTAKDIKEMVDTTLQDYMKAEPILDYKPLLPRKTILADEPIAVS